MNLEIVLGKGMKRFMNKRKDTPRKGLEDYAILISFVVCFLLTLGAFAWKSMDPVSANILTKFSYYSYAWLCCLAISQCIRCDMHLRIGMFDKIMPDLIKKILRMISSFICFLVTAGMFVGSLVLLIRTWIHPDTMAKDVSWITLILGFLAPIAGCGMAIIRCVIDLWRGGKE